MDDAEFLDTLDLDIGDLDGLTPGHNLLDAVIHEDTSDALHQASERCFVELVITSEAMHHFGFGSLCVGVSDVLGKRVVLNCRTASVLAFSAA